MDAAEQKPPEGIERLQKVYDKYMDKLEEGGLTPEALARLGGIVSGIEIAAAVVERDVYADWARRHGRRIVGSGQDDGPQRTVIERAHAQEPAP